MKDTATEMERFENEEKAIKVGKVCCVVCAKLVDAMKEFNGEIMCEQCYESELAFND